MISARKRLCMYVCKPPYSICHTGYEGSNQMRTGQSPTSVFRSCPEAWSAHRTDLSMLEERSYLPQAVGLMAPRRISTAWNQEPCARCRLGAALKLLGLWQHSLEVLTREMCPCVDCAAPSAVIYLHSCVQTHRALLRLAELKVSPLSHRPLGCLLRFLERGAKSQGRSLASVVQTGLKSQSGASNTRWQSTAGFPGLVRPTPDPHFFFLFLFFSFLTGINGYW